MPVGVGVAGAADRAQIEARSYADRDRTQIETILAEAEAQAEYARAALGALTRREVEAELTNPTLTLTLP